MPIIPVEDLQDKTKMQAHADKLQSAAKQKGVNVATYQVALGEDTETGNFSLVITVSHHGLTNSYEINKILFASNDYQRIVELGNKLDELMEEGAFVTKGDKQKKVRDFPAALNWLINEAKRGQAIQRYKGLGEMNPGQLWETTMDPNTRRMLQVTIEDAIAADQLFTTLMGDQVEPRREFIEQNALNVVNLDV